MDFAACLKSAFSILKLDEKEIKKVTKEKDALPYGILIIAIGSLLSSISGYIQLKFFSMELPKELSFLPTQVTSSTFIFAPIAGILGVGILAGMIHLIAKLFKGKAGFGEFFRVASFASLIQWISIIEFIPVLGNIVSLATLAWTIVVLVTVVRSVYNISTAKAVASVAIPLVIVILFIILLAFVVAGAIVASGIDLPISL